MTEPSTSREQRERIKYHKERADKVADQTRALLTG